MTTQDNQPVPCTGCRMPLNEAWRYCPNCGRAAKAGAARQWYYNPIVIVSLAFFILGPFALPLVWKSPYMGKKWKCFHTAWIVAYTVFLGYTSYKAAVFAVEYFNNMMGMQPY